MPRHRHTGESRYPVPGPLDSTHAGVSDRHHFHTLVCRSQPGMGGSRERGRHLSDDAPNCVGAGAWAQMAPNPPPPSFPRRRESIPGKVRHHYPGTSLSRGPLRSGGESGWPRIVDAHERTCYYSSYEKPTACVRTLRSRSVQRPGPRFNLAQTGTSSVHLWLKSVPESS